MRLLARIGWTETCVALLAASAAQAGTPVTGGTQVKAKKSVKKAVKKLLRRLPGP